MNFLKPISALVVLSALGLPLTTPARAEQRHPTIALRYKWTMGQTLRYLVQQDPYFADPASAIETTDLSAPYRPPSVLRLIEQVLAVGKDGTATLRLSLTPEPGFEEEGRPSLAEQVVTVTALGQVVSGDSGLVAPELLSAVFRLPQAVPSAKGAFVILTQDDPPCEMKSITPSHDGLLQQTTQSRRCDRAFFGVGDGMLVRRRISITGSLSLVMIRPRQRAAADFGRVVPNLPIFQTLTIELEPYVGLPLLASAARQSKS